MTISEQATPLNADNSEYKQVLKNPKVHNRCIVGINFFRDPHTKQLVLASFAHDSLKLWNVSVFDDDFELSQWQQITRWRCGVQSWDSTNNGALMAIVGVESTLHLITFDESGEATVEDIPRGILETWFVQISADRQHFLTANLYAEQLQLLDREGQIVMSAPFEKLKQTSSLAYGSKFIALGNTHGVINVLNTLTLSTLYIIEGHSMKVRCLVFALDGKQLLSGADDKTIKLFSLADNKGVLVRTYCGHKGSVQGISLDRASAGERFASCGSDNSIIIWNLSTGEKLHIFENCTNSANDNLHCVAFSPDGRFLAAGTGEASIFAFKVPIPENFVEEEVPEVEPMNDLAEADEQEQPATPVTPVEEYGGYNAAALDDEPEPIDDQLNPLSQEGTPNDAEELLQPEDHDDSQQQPQNVDYSEEFERRELEMQLGID